MKSKKQTGRVTSSQQEYAAAALREAKKFVKKLIGSQELIKGIERWCLWIEDDEIESEEYDPELDKPRMNYSCFSSSPPTASYDDKGDSVQNKILGE